MEDLEHFNDEELDIQADDLNEIINEMANHLIDADNGVMVETTNDYEMTIAETPVQHNGVLIRAEEDQETHNIQVNNASAVVRIYHQEERELNVIIEGSLVVEGNLTVTGNLTTTGHIEHFGQTVEKNIYVYHIGKNVLKLDATNNSLTFNDEETKSAQQLGNMIIKSLRDLHDGLNVNDAKEFFKQ